MIITLCHFVCSVIKMLCIEMDLLLPVSSTLNISQCICRKERENMKTRRVYKKRENCFLLVQTYSHSSHRFTPITQLTTNSCQIPILAQSNKYARGRRWNRRSTVHSLINHFRTIFIHILVRILAINGKHPTSHQTGRSHRNYYDCQINKTSIYKSWLNITINVPGLPVEITDGIN